MSNRLTGTLTAIDEPTLRVGDPIRIHMYDEHPHKPVTVTLVEEKEENASEKSNTTEEGEEKRKKTETVTNTGTPTPAFDPLVFPEQAVFYVTAIERSIDPSNTSTMTLQLKAGRKMGVASVFDVMSLMYNMYYKDFQTRGFYEANGGNDTAVKTPHLKDENQERQEHEAYRRQRSAPDKNQSKGKESNDNSDGTSPMRGQSEGKKP